MKLALISALNRRRLRRKIAEDRARALDIPTARDVARAIERRAKADLLAPQVPA